MTKFAAIAAAAIATLGLLGIFALTLRSEPVTQVASTDAFAHCRKAKVAGEATIGGPFTLLNSTGQTVTEKDVITEPSLLYFGYTFCPDICPLDVDRNAVAVEILEERGMSVTPVFITIDPDRDTPELVGEFASNLHPKMIGLTGSQAQVTAATQAYRTYSKAHKNGTDDYLVDHSTYSYLVLPKEGFVELFPRNLSPEALADAISCFIN